MSQQRSDTSARRQPASGARNEKAGRQPRGEGAAMNPRFYRPRFKVTLPEGEAGFVPGYN